MRQNSLAKKRKLGAEDQSDSPVSASASETSENVDSNVTITIGREAGVDAENILNDRDYSMEQLAGYIFMCNAQTKSDCFTYRVFGLPASRIGVIAKIKPNTRLFLFDFDLKLLYGLYVADSSGKLALEPHAFGGRFPAQVRFSITEDCLPLPEVAFKPAIKDNYQTASKFKQDLNYEQVNSLVSLFRPIMLVSPPHKSLALHNAVKIERHVSSAQINSRLSHGRVVAVPELNDMSRHSSYRLVQEVPMSPLHSTHNQVSLARSGAFSSQSDVSYDQHQSAYSPRIYHPDDSSLQQHTAHIRYETIARRLSSSNEPEVIHGHLLSNGSNSIKGVYTYQNYQRQRYPTSQGAVSATSQLPVHSYETNLASVNSSFPHESQPESSGVGSVDANSFSYNANSTYMPYGHEIPTNNVSYPTPPATVYQEVNNAHYHESDVHRSEWATTAACYTSNVYPGAQVVVPEVSADPRAASTSTTNMEMGYGFQNQGYAGYYQAQAQQATTDQGVSSLPVHSQVEHPYYTSHYAVDQGVSALSQTLPGGSVVAADNAHSYYQQGYYSSHQVAPMTAQGSWNYQ